MAQRKARIRQAIVVSQELSDIGLQELFLQITLGNQNAQNASTVLKNNNSWHFSFSHVMHFDKQDAAIQFLIRTGKQEGFYPIAKSSFLLDGLSVYKQHQKKIILLSQDQAKVVGLLFIVIEQIHSDWQNQTQNPLFCLVQKIQVEFNDPFKRLRYVQIRQNNNLRHIQRLKCVQNNSQTSNSVLIKPLKPSSFLEVSFKQSKSGNKKAQVNYMFDKIEKGKKSIIQSPLHNYDKHVIGKVKLTYFLNNLYLSNQWELPQIQKRASVQNGHAKDKNIQDKVYKSLGSGDFQKSLEKDIQNQKKAKDIDIDIEIKPKKQKRGRLSDFFEGLDISQGQLIHDQKKT